MGGRDRVVVLGGTGLLGQHIAVAVVADGREPVLVARHDAELLPELRAGLQAAGLPTEPVHVDVLAADEGALRELVAGAQAVVMALGPDDRDLGQRHLPGFYDSQLVQPTERIARACRAEQVGHLVVLGSYFTAQGRRQPGFVERHPYMRARLAQATRAIAAGGGRAEGGTDVSILEIPYVFGTVPGRVPIWRHLFFEPMRLMPVAIYPTGGSSVVSAAQVGQAAAGAADRGRHGVHYPLADEQWTWAQLFGLVRVTMGRNRTILPLPRWVAEPVMWLAGLWMRRGGAEPGLTFRYLLRDVMYAYLFVDGSAAQQELGMRRGGVPEAVVETVAASYPD